MCQHFTLQNISDVKPNVRALSLVPTVTETLASQFPGAATHLAQIDELLRCQPRGWLVCTLKVPSLLYHVFLTEYLV